MVLQETVINGKKIAYWENGFGDKTLVFLHGFRGNHKGLVDVAKGINGYKILIPDLPGYGGSEPLEKPHTFENYTHFINDFLSNLGIKKCVIAGHSFGASLALVFAGFYPSKTEKLILIAPVSDSKNFEASIGKAYYNIAVRMPKFIKSIWLKSRLADLSSNIVLLKTPDYKRRIELIIDGQRNLKKLDEKIIIENFLSYYSTNFKKISQKIKSPTLILGGTKDRLATKDNLLLLQKDIFGSEIKILPHIGHIAPLENPKELADAIDQFLD